MGQEQADAGKLHRGDRRVGLRRPVARDAVGRQDRLRGDHRGGGPPRRGRARDPRARLRRRVQLQGLDQQKRVGDLSGGERNRLHLAKVLSSGGNVLLLDEPTNDLDVDTLRALEDALLDFPGCAVVISHDRWFLDRIATHMLAFEGEPRPMVRGQLQRLRGGPEQAPRHRGRPAPSDAVQAARPRLSRRARGGVSGPQPAHLRVRRGTRGSVGHPQPRWGGAVGHPDEARRAGPKDSRCTQLAAFGRSSPSGIRWSTRTRRKASTTSSPRVGRPRASRTRSTFNEASPSARFSRTWIPGGRAIAEAEPGPVKSTKKSEVRSPTSNHEPL